MILLDNKKVLFVGVRIHGYEESIISGLEKIGAHVDFFKLFDKSYLFQSKLKRLYGIEKQERNHYAQLLRYNGYDYIIVLQGFQISDEIYIQLKHNNPHAKFINFHWDSIKESYNYLNISKYFDKVFSFDHKDCSEYQNLEYLPLFYIEDYERIRYDVTEDNQDIDVLFIGSWRNKERYALIKEAKKFCVDNDLKIYSYLYIEKLSFIRSFLTLDIKKDSSFKSLDHKDIVSLFRRSKVILDLPSSFQTGLTMRTFEALGAGKRLITTNRSIINEPFYNESYISIIQTAHLEFDINFIKNKAAVKVNPCIADYSINSFIQKLLS